MTAETWSFWQPMSLIKSLQDTQFSLLQVRKTIIFLSWLVLVIVDSCLFITEFSSLVISLQHLDYRLAADWRFIDNKLTTTSKVTTKDNSTQNTLYMPFLWSIESQSYLVELNYANTLRTCEISCPSSNIWQCLHWSSPPGTDGRGK